MTEAGIRVGLGEDGQRDYWSPYGNCDMLDRTWQLAFTTGFRKDELIEHCAGHRHHRAAPRIMDRTHPAPHRSTATGPGLRVGDRADLVLVDGETVDQHGHGPRHRPHRHPRRQASSPTGWSSCRIRPRNSSGAA